MRNNVFLFACMLICTMQSHAHDADQNQVSITTDSQYRYIKSNGIPYTHGDFPNPGNPNSIQAQNYNFRVPLNPNYGNGNTPLQGFMDFGVGIDGVPFDPGTAEFWNNDPNWRYEALTGKINLGMDQNNAHVQPNGAYHYHGSPTELIDAQTPGQHSLLVGYAADGFPIYVQYGYSDPKDPNSPVVELHSSYQLKTGNRPSGPGGAYDGTFTQDYTYVQGAGNLDECNGIYTVTPDYPNGTYAYFISSDFPFVPRCFKGTPDQSFVKQGGGPGRVNRMQSPYTPRQGARGPQGGPPLYGPPGPPPMGPQGSQNH